MRIKFNRDFRGRETDEVFYTQGDVADVSDAFALVLVADGVAERTKEGVAPKPEVKVAEPEPEVEAEPPADQPENPDMALTEKIIENIKKGKGK